MCYIGFVERNLSAAEISEPVSGGDQTMHFKKREDKGIMSNSEMIPKGNPDTGKSSSGSMGKIILLIICFPFIIAAAGTIFGLTVGACGLVFGLMAGICSIIFSFILAGFAAVFSLIIHIIAGHTAMGLVTAGAGLLLAGMGILLIPLLRSTVSFSISLIRKIIGFVKRLFTRRTA